MHQTPGYHHVTIVETGRTAYLAGQCPLDRNGDVVPGGLTAQIDAVATNVLTALTAIDAKPTDVIRSVIYVVTPDRDLLAATWARLNESPIAEAFTTASTLLGVAQLGYPGQLIEIELTAALKP